MPNYTVTLGDWSDDGHGKTNDFVISSDSTYEEITEAYKRGEKELGIKFVKNYCSDYEDNTIDVDLVNALKANGINITLDKYELEELEENGTCGIWHDTYFFIWLELVRLGKPPHPITDISTKTQNFKIGGYGLFH